MFGFGNKAQKKESWFDFKSEKIEDVLGPALEQAMYYIVPPTEFAPGVFVHPADGTFSVSTRGLSELPGKGASNSLYKNYELAMFSRSPLSVDDDGMPDPKEGDTFMVLRYCITVLADYAMRAVLNVGDTIEFPEDYDDELGGKCFFVWALDPDKFEDGFGVLTLMEVHRTEMQYAREKGPLELFEKLEAAGAYPYSPLDRPPVV